MLDLLPELSFGDNVRPSQVTSALRERLVSEQIRLRSLSIRTIILGVLGLNVGLAAAALRFPDTLNWSTFFAWEATATAAIIIGIWMLYSPRIRFLREAPVVAAAVMESGATSLWGLGAIRWGKESSARSVVEAMEEEDAGVSEPVLHIVKVRLRFRPGTTNERLTWDDLRDEVPHCDVTKTLRGGGWGTFASGLKQGSLVSLFYAAQNPSHCRIVQRFQSHESLFKEIEEILPRS